MELWVILVLIISGIFVGFINTLAGSATVISITVLTFLGLPINVANGTHRVAVLFQNIIAVRGFYKHKMLDIKKGIHYAIPTAIGSILGAYIAVEVDKRFLEISVGSVMLIILSTLIFKPERWLVGNDLLNKKKISLLQYFLFFLIGVYGGFVHIGVGIFILAILVINSGYDLIKANGLKNLLVLFYVPFALGIFIFNGMVDFQYGLIHAMGNMIGAWLATRYALDWGAKFIRWLVMVILFLGAIHFLGIGKFIYELI